jgi:hypothetical protein
VEESWKPAADVRGWAKYLSRIVIGDSAEESGSSQSVSGFVFEMIERGQSLDSNTELSFVDIFGFL